MLYEPVPESTEVVNYWSYVVFGLLLILPIIVLPIVYKYMMLRQKIVEKFSFYQALENLGIVYIILYFFAKVISLFSVFSLFFNENPRITSFFILLICYGIVFFMKTVQYPNSAKKLLKVFLIQIILFIIGMFGGISLFTSLSVDDNYESNFVEENSINGERLGTQTEKTDDHAFEIQVLEPEKVAYDKPIKIKVTAKNNQGVITDFRNLVELRINASGGFPYYYKYKTEDKGVHIFSVIIKKPNNNLLREHNSIRNLYLSDSPYGGGTVKYYFADTVFTDLDYDNKLDPVINEPRMAYEVANELYK